MKLSASDIVLRLLGVLLLVAAVLKGWQLMTEPVANNSIWTMRWFLILQVEAELFLGVWLLSGLFRKLAWLVGLGCFAMFSVVTLYKGINGAASCGCFGSVHVNPWITLFAIDLPAVVALVIFRPRNLSVKTPLDLLMPIPRLMQLNVCVSFLVVLLVGSTTVLAMNEPAKLTQDYMVLEPEMWIGEELPILEYIDIGEQLRTGNWLVLFYHHDCPDCQEAIPQYEQMARYLADNEELLRIAFVEVPPFGPTTVGMDGSWAVGSLSDSRDWFVTTPVVILVEDGQVHFGWQGEAPVFEDIVECVN